MNPSAVIEESNAIENFISYLEPFLQPQSIQERLPPSDVVGNIRFSHPTLYVFPGGQGDSALFGINGFNMLIEHLNLSFNLLFCELRRYFYTET